MAQPLEYEQIGANSAGGMVYGATSTDRVSFWGNVPVTRPVTASTDQVSTTVGQSMSSVGVATTSWGFATRVEAINFITAVSSIHYACKQLGIIAGPTPAVVTDSSRTWDVLDYGSPDGAQFGRSATDSIAFYGATPVARASFNVSTSQVSTTSTNSTTANGSIVTSWAFLTSDEFTVITSAVSTMQMAMKQLGLIA